MAGVFGGAKASKNLEIHLDTPFAVFYGDQHEAEPVAVTGTLVLNSPDHMNVRGVKVKLEGKWRVTWATNGASTTSAAAATTIRDKGTLISDEQQFIPAPGTPVTTHRIAPGRHEWRFKFTLDPSLPESIEGLAGCFVVYTLSAEIDRGYMSKAFVATKHVRVIRTLSRDMTETVPFPYSNEDSWADKIKYHIYIPSRYYAFGTSIPVEFTLFPLRKGVKIGKIKMEVLERIALETGRQGEQGTSTTLPDRIVAHIEQMLPRDSSGRLVDESSGIADDSYHFKVVLPLKKSLNSCRQTVNTDHIKVNHNLKIYVNIHNPDGHISQLCLRNLIHIYISPHTRINDGQVLSPTSPLERADAGLPLDEGTANLAAPPTYGTHVLDQLYEDIDPAGFHSGFATPAPFSRNPSSEDLATLLANAFPDRASAENSDHSSTRSSSLTESAALQLQNRLAALQDRRPSIPQITEPQNTPPEDFPNSNLHPSGIRTGTNSARHSGIFSLSRRRGHSTNNSLSLPSNIPIGQLMSHLQGQITPPHTTNPSAPRPGPSVLLNGSRHSPPAAMAFDLEALSRTPSYNTAVRSPYTAQSPTADTEGLPSYDFACGLAVQPASPGALSTPLPPTPPAEADSSGNPLSRQNSPEAPSASHKQHTPPQQPTNAFFSNYTGFSPPANSSSSLLAPPLRAHVRHSSSSQADVHNALAVRLAADAERRRPTVAMGGGSLAELWSGMRRGSH